MSVKNNGKWVTALALGTALLSVSGMASAAPAPPLTSMTILDVESPACGREDVRRVGTTACDHGGGTIIVRVLEVGYGHPPRATIDGIAVSGTQILMCQPFRTLVQCTGVGRVVGFQYVYRINGKQGGNFNVINSSINVPRRSFTEGIYIR